MGCFCCQLFHICESKWFCFIVAMTDLVHVMENMNGKCLLLTTSGNLFLLSAVSCTSFIIQKRFPDAVNNSGK